jgi:hypothetical protein
MRYLRIGGIDVVDDRVAGGGHVGAASVSASIRSADEKRDELSEFFKEYIGLSSEQIRAIRVVDDRSQRYWTRQIPLFLEASCGPLVRPVITVS